MALPTRLREEIGTSHTSRLKPDEPKSWGEPEDVYPPSAAEEFIVEGGDSGALEIPAAPSV